MIVISSFPVVSNFSFGDDNTFWVVESSFCWFKEIVFGNERRYNCGLSFNFFLKSGPHNFWCNSQSRCWQYCPQYRAILQPEHVSIAFLPQCQQCSGPSSCRLSNVYTSSKVWVFNRWYCSRSRIKISLDFCSVCETAFCKSMIDWRFISKTVSSAFRRISAIRSSVCVSNSACLRLHSRSFVSIRRRRWISFCCKINNTLLLFCYHFKYTIKHIFSIFPIIFYIFKISCIFT